MVFDQSFDFLPPNVLANLPQVFGIWTFLNQQNLMRTTKLEKPHSPCGQVEPIVMWFLIGIPF